MHAVGIDGDDFTGFDFADKFRADLVQRAGFAAQHVAFADRTEMAFGMHTAQHQRTETLRIARADQFVGGHEQKTERTFELPQAMRQMIRFADVFWPRE